MNLVSIVIFRIRNEGKTFVVLPEDVKKIGNGLEISFPKGSFNQYLNGDLSETVLRVLNDFVEIEGGKYEIEYIGSFIKASEKYLEIGYKYQIKNFTGRVLIKNFDWIDDADLEKYSDIGFKVDDSIRAFF